MKPTMFLLAVLFSSLSLMAENRAEQIRAELLNPESDKVLVAAHRADWRNYPENSLEGIESAINMGVHIVELDLQCTADSQLIIMHDPTLNRTTTGKGKISEMTLDSILTFRLKNGVAIHTSYRIPTLCEVLLLCKGRVLVNLDKADRYFHLIMSVLQETGTARQIIMKGRKSPEEVKVLYGHCLDDVIYMPILNMDNASSVESLSEYLSMKPAAFELCFRFDDRYMQQAASILQGKSSIWINCLWDTLCGGHEDDKALHAPDEHYGYLLDTLHARILQTDRPEYLLNYLNNRNR